MSQRKELKAGEVFDEKFEIDRKVGQGRLREDVYLANDKELEQTVAVRVLPSDISIDEESLKRFKQSIKLCANLQHPNIQRAFRAGESDGMHYFVTAADEGTFLDRRLEKDGALAESDALDMVMELADALDYAWDKEKLIHRNIRPQTILIDKQNHPILTDFGLSKSIAKGAQSLTIAGAKIGNPEFMSPEQIEVKGELDFRADMYCLGLVLYTMLASKPPFEGQGMGELFEAQLKKNPKPIREVNPNVSEECSAIIDKMLSKKKEDRHQSWGDLLEDLRAAHGGEAPSSVEKIDSLNDGSGAGGTEAAEWGIADTVGAIALLAVFAVLLAYFLS